MSIEKVNLNLPQKNAILAVLAERSAEMFPGMGVPTNLSFFENKDKEFGYQVIGHITFTDEASHIYVFLNRENDVVTAGNLDTFLYLSEPPIHLVKFPLISEFQGRVSFEIVNDEVVLSFNDVTKKYIFLFLHSGFKTPLCIKMDTVAGEKNVVVLTDSKDRIALFSLVNGRRSYVSSEFERINEGLYLCKIKKGASTTYFYSLFSSALKGFPLCLLHPDSMDYYSTRFFNLYEIKDGVLLLKEYQNSFILLNTETFECSRRMLLVNGNAWPMYLGNSYYLFAIGLDRTMVIVGPDMKESVLNEIGSSRIEVGSLEHENCLHCVVISYEDEKWIFDTKNNFFLRESFEYCEQIVPGVLKISLDGDNNYCIYDAVIGILIRNSGIYEIDENGNILVGLLDGDERKTNLSCVVYPGNHVGVSFYNSPVKMTDDILLYNLGGNQYCLFNKKTYRYSVPFAGVVTLLENGAFKITSPSKSSAYILNYQDMKMTSFAFES